jgi:hypothetical protein
MRPNRLISCLAIAGVLVAVAAVPASADGPTVSATPNQNLVDAQPVMVSASGFAADRQMAVVECGTVTVSPATCDLNTVAFVVTDDTGAYSGFAFTVQRVLSDGTDCALNGGCYIATQEDTGAGPSANTLITFDPAALPFEFAVRIDKTLIVNDKGVVALTGVVRCRNVGADVAVEVDVQTTVIQVVNRVIFFASGFAAVTCSADGSVPFRATVRPANGLYGPGPAVVKLNAFADDRFIARRVAVELRASGTSGARDSAKPSLAWR